METMLSKMAIFNALLEKLNGLRNEWAVKRVDYEIGQVVLAGRPDGPEKLKIVRDELGTVKDLIGSVERRLLALVNIDTVEEVRIKFAELVNAHSIVNELENMLVTKQLLLEIYSTSNTTPIDSDANNPFDMADQQRRVADLVAQIASAKAALESLAQKLTISDPSSLIVSNKPTIQIVR